MIWIRFFLLFFFCFNLVDPALSREVSVSQILEQYPAIAVKKMSASDCAKNKTNMQELHGVNELVRLMGPATQKQRFETDFYYLQDDLAPLHFKRKTTWYLTGKGKTWEEPRLYYGKNNPVIAKAQEGDVLLLAKASEEQLIFMIISQKSSDYQNLLVQFENEEEKAAREPAISPSLKPLDLQVFRNTETRQIIVIGKVSMIKDGDTIVIDDLFNIRMYGIDAPEKRQKCQTPYGKEYACGEKATAYLTKLIGKKKLSCVHHASDKYGRFVFQCDNAAGTDINQAMVAAGMAVAEYGDDYQDAETTAKKAQLGIWNGSFVRPNRWRKGER